MGRLNDVWDQLFPVERHRIANLMIERIDLVHIGELQGIKVKWRELGWDKLIGEFAPRETSKKHYGKQTGHPITQELPAPAGGVRLETFVPWILVRRGLKKQIITPLDAPQEFLSEANRERAAQAAAQDSALMRALGLAHHWQRLLDEERFASLTEIAKAEGMDVTQVRRVMRLTLLAPEVVELLVGAPDIVLEQVMRRPWPLSWSEQRQIV